MFAFACHPSKTMESRIGWNRAVLAAKRFDTTVLFGEDVSIEELEREKQSIPWKNALTFIKVPHSTIGKYAINVPGFFYYCYGGWQKRAFQYASKLQEAISFDVVHQVTYCGYREPGHGWKLPCKFVWGPIGGTQNFPVKFSSELGLGGVIRELSRNAINRYQLRHSRHVLKAVRKSSVLVVANSTVEADAVHNWGVTPKLQLEIGISGDSIHIKEKRPPNQPLRILWAGRLKPWKCLSLLIRGLEKLPEDCPVQVRVLGVGEYRARWQKLAKKLGVDGCIEWVGWPVYESSLVHYDWADVFAFTSMRDTSGTGILESLASGTPIIGVRHQGMQDILTYECGIGVEVTNPCNVADQFRDAIVSLSRDRERLEKLSHGAMSRASKYSWEKLGVEMDCFYESLGAFEKTNDDDLEGSNPRWKAVPETQRENFSFIRHFGARRMKSD